MHTKGAVFLQLCLVLAIAGCGGHEEHEAGTITDTCTGELVGYITEDGTHVFYTGLQIAPSDIQVVEHLPSTPQQECTVPESSPHTGALQPLDTGFGTHSFLHFMTHSNGVTCQLIIEQWCWNGSCSSRVVTQCGDGDEVVNEYI